MREITGLPRMTLTLTAAEITRVSYGYKVDVQILNYGSGNVFVSEGDAVISDTANAEGVIPAIMLAQGAADVFSLGSAPTTLWLKADAPATVIIRAINS